MAATANETAARELLLFIINDETLYKQRTVPITVNLARKKKKGVYDALKAVKLWQYLADDGARRYEKQHGQVGVKIFNKPTRELTAKGLLSYYDELVNELAIGNSTGSKMKRVGSRMKSRHPGYADNPVRVSRGGRTLMQTRDNADGTVDIELEEATFKNRSPAQADAMAQRLQALYPGATRERNPRGTREDAAMAGEAVRLNAGYESGRYGVRYKVGKGKWKMMSVKMKMPGSLIVDLPRFHSLLVQKEKVPPTALEVFNEDTGATVAVHDVARVSVPYPLQTQTEKDAFDVFRVYMTQGEKSAADFMHNMAATRSLADYGALRHVVQSMIAGKPWKKGQVQANPSEIHIDINSHNTGGRNNRAKNPVRRPALKISANLVDRMHEGVRQVLSHPQWPTHVQMVIDSGKFKDLNKRLRWDALYAAQNIGVLPKRFVVDEVYPNGANDDHIDSALKWIMADLGVTYSNVKNNPRKKNPADIAGRERKANPTKRKSSRPLLEFKRDRNGNRTVLVRAPAGSFSIQTNGNLPMTHRMTVNNGFNNRDLQTALNEISAWVRAHGTARQRKLMESIPGNLQPGSYAKNPKSKEKFYPQVKLNGEWWYADENGWLFRELKNSKVYDVRKRADDFAAGLAARLGLKESRAVSGSRKKNPSNGWDHYDFRIASHYLPALINGDTSGLSGNDEHLLEQFIANADLPPGHWDVDSDAEEHFATDEVSGLKAMVVDVRYVFRAGKGHEKNPRARKTRDVFEVRGNYGHGYEMVTAETTRKEANARLREYRENEPGVDFKIVVTREKI